LDLSGGSLARHPAGSRAAWTLAAAIVGSSMSFIDGSAVNVALPILQRDLSASSQNVQWVVEGYSLFLAALILIGGSLGDIFGRRLVFGTGIALFGVASMACGLAPDVRVLIVGRCVQGVGGALATPGSLALIGAAFTGDARGRAIGTWSGFSAITSAIGPLLGGWLVGLGSWRYVFFINVPLALLVIAVLTLRVDESRDQSSSRRIDVTGAAFATLGLGALVYGLIRLQAAALDTVGLGAVALGGAALVAFLAIERREKDPMIRLDLFRSRTFAAANVYTFLLYAALGGSFYFLPFDLIDVQKYSPAQAGAALLPFIAIMFAFSRFSGGLVARIGAHVPLALGAALAAAGFASFSFAGVGHSYWIAFFPGVVLLGLGGACFVAPLTTTVMDAVDVSHAGVASGINNAVSRAAGLIAIAALGIALTQTFAPSLTRELRGANVSAPARAALARNPALLAANRIPPEISDPADRRAVGAALAGAFAAGFRIAMWCSALLALLAAALAFDRSFRRSVTSR
jgi:EmrB/QacA subfamily drug resistance transporter